MKRFKAAAKNSRAKWDENFELQLYNYKLVGHIIILYNYKWVQQAYIVVSSLPCVLKISGIIPDFE
jgi:hypothetical protein